MEVVTSNAQGRVPITVLHIKGEVDTTNYEELMAQVSDVYAGGARDVIVDLSEVPYISSAGLRALHHTYALLRDKEAQEDDQTVSKGLREGSYKALHLKLLKPTPRVAEVLHLSGFDMYLDIFDKMEDAVQAF